MPCMHTEAPVTMPETERYHKALRSSIGFVALDKNRSSSSLQGTHFHVAKKLSRKDCHKWVKNYLVQYCRSCVANGLMYNMRGLLQMSDV